MSNQPEIMNDKVVATTHDGQQLVEVNHQPQDEGSQMMAMIAAAVSDPNTDVSKMRDLMAMRKEYLAEKAEKAFSEAMNAAQAEMSGVRVGKNKTNTHTKSKFANLEAIDKALRPIYSKHGFSLSFDTNATEGGMVTVTCKVTHRDNHSRNYVLSGALDDKGSGGNANKTGIQALGSTISYLRRYLTLMIFNIVIDEEDNDGNAPPKTISEIQRGIILEKLDGPGERVAKFCEFAGIPKLDDLPAKDFDRAIAEINKTNAAKAKKGAE